MFNKKKSNSDKMSQSDSINSDLELDDEDLSKQEEKNKTETKKTEKEVNSDYSSGDENPINFLFRKRRKRKEEKSDLSEENPTKKKKKELTTFQKSYIASQKEEFVKNFSILKSDFNYLEEYEKKIFKDTNLDIMFIMDLTGSMSIWLNEAKANITNIIKEITENNPGSKIRASFIGYKDYESKDETREYFVKEFTENIKEINDYIQNLNCSGGGDLPEDVVGALKQALEMKWESEAKYAILVCDAPCHGKSYHDLRYDTFEEGDPDGTTLEYVMEKFKSKNINFYCLEIDSSTDKMFNIMQKIYCKEKFQKVKLSDSGQFSFFVAFSASMVLNNEKYRKNKIQNIIEQYRKESIEEILKKYMNNNIAINNINNNTEKDLIEQIENLNIGEEDKKLLDFVNRMNDLNINNNSNDKINNMNNIINDNNKDNFIEINIVPEIIKNFKNKNINYIIKSITYNKNSNIVNDWTNPALQEFEFETHIKLKNIKINNENKNYYKISFYDNKLKKDKTGQIPLNINKDLYNNISKYIKQLYYDEIICQQIADYFNILLKEKDYDKKFVKFTRHIIYELNTNIKNQETKDLMTDEFCKNFKYILSEYTVCSSELELLDKRDLECFTHFSYQITGGQLIITDLEYNNFQCNNFKIFKKSEGGYKKIFEFFASHICNSTCKSLELIHPRKKINYILNDVFYNEKYLTNVSLCENCGIPIDLFEKNEKAEYTICGNCEWNELENTYEIKCKKCSKLFSYSEFHHQSILQTYPKYCKKCRNDFHT